MNEKGYQKVPCGEWEALKGRVTALEAIAAKLVLEQARPTGQSLTPVERVALLKSDLRLEVTNALHEATPIAQSAGQETIKNIFAYASKWAKASQQSNA